jgi:hypothetical protein
VFFKGRRENSKNKQTYLSWFLKKEGERRREEEEEEEEEREEGH